MSRCKNCHSPLESAYCPSCGQRDLDLERPIWSLAGDVLKETFELDGRSASTIKVLFRDPGRLTQEFLAGRRRAYTSPLRLYLAISIIFFVLAAWIAQSGVWLAPGQDPRLDAAVQSGFLSEDLPKLMFLLLPIFALSLKAVYWHRLYFDHLIFALHLHSACYVMLAIVMPLEAFEDRWAALVALQFALLVYFLLYLVTAMRRVYRSGWFGSAFRSAFVLGIYILVASVVIENTSSFLIIAD